MAFSTSLIRNVFFFSMIVLTLLPIASCYAQEYASYCNNKKVYYEPSTSQVLVKFKDAATLTRREKNLAVLGSGAIKSLMELPGVALLSIAPGKTKAAIQEMVAQLLTDADIIQAAPVLLNGEGKPFGAVSDQFIIKLKASTSRVALQRMLAQTGASIVHQLDADDKTFYLKVDKKRGDAMTLANLFYESGLFEYSEPNFVLFIEPTTNDPFYNQQYAINNTGQT